MHREPLDRLPPAARAFWENVCSRASAGYLPKGWFDGPRHPDPEVLAVTWSCIDDDHTCPACRELDGVTWRPDDLTLLYPPFHWYCRCVHVLALRGAKYVPLATGLPAGYELPDEVIAFWESCDAFDGPPIGMDRDA